MKNFIPKRVFFEPQALDYPLGKELYERFRQMDIPIQLTGSHNRVTGIPGSSPQEAFREAKQTLVVGVRKSTDFVTCKPSAHYQLPLNTSCPGMCEYCYLATTLGKKPYIRVYVNIEDILDRAKRYMEERAPDITVFEGAAVSDPIPTEHLTGLLKQTITFFGEQPWGRFRFVTKFTDVASLLPVRHAGHTRFRFSINAASVLQRFEHGTPGLTERLAAAREVAKAGYPLGFILAPVFRFPGWRQEYQAAIASLQQEMAKAAAVPDLTFEIITHRFTKRAKNNILDLYPHTQLPLDETERMFKYGQFGYGKYIYPKEEMKELKDFLTEELNLRFPTAAIEYFV